MSEVWKDIPGYEGYYQASDQGRIRSLDRVVPHRTLGSVKRQGSEMTQYQDRDGYMKVKLSKGGRKKVCSVHRLVLLAFEGEPNGRVCCHNNGARSDNRRENLRWGTPKENSLDMVEHKTNYWIEKDHCRAGHPYTGKMDSGHRRCEECRKETERKRRERRIRESGRSQPLNGKNKTSCERGHPLSGDNLLLVPATSERGEKRMCRCCRSSREALRRRGVSTEFWQQMSDLYFEYSGAKVPKEKVDAVIK